MPSHVPHWVDGRAADWPVGRTADVVDPATGAPARQVPLASAAEVDRAVRTAEHAYRSWSETSVTKRTQVMFAFRELLHAHRDDLAEIITAENGKTLADAAGEITRGLEVVEFACGMGHLLKGGYNDNVSTGVDAFSLRQPLGVTAVITPFNFPLMVPLWFAPVSVACGNAVVLKPSEKVPSASVELGRLWKRAGLPDGVFTVVHGDGEAVDALLTHPGVDSVSFVGSTPVARHVYGTATAAGKRVQALGGAKNHMVVLPDADLDAAADAAVAGGFGSAGQRCMAVSALVVVEPAGDELVARVRDRIAGLRVGDGRRGCDVGPLITAGHRDRVGSYVDAGVRDGAEPVVDGRKPTVDGEDGGHWLGPTLLDRVRPDMSVYTDEVFGPVLSVVRVPSYEDALRLVNDNPHGNGGAVFTADGGAARRFLREARVGMVGVNVPVPVPVAYHSFGGWKNSLFGDAHAHGTDGVHFFTRGKVVTSRWQEPSRRGAGGVDLGFPQNR